MFAIIESYRKAVSMFCDIASHVPAPCKERGVRPKESLNNDSSVTLAFFNP